MPKRGKKYLEALKLVDRTKLYEVNEAIDLALKTAVMNFDETIEVAVRLGVDPDTPISKSEAQLCCLMGQAKASECWYLQKVIR